MNGLGVASEIAGAGTALAGLILVYLGALATGFDGFEPQEKRAVKLRFLKRAWVAFGGVVLALTAAALAITGKLFANACAANASVVLLAMSFVWGIFIAYLTVREID